MADLLGEVEANILPARTYAKKTVISESRRKVRVLSPPPTQERKPRILQARYESKAGQLADTPPAQSAFDDDDGFPLPLGDDDVLMSDPLPSSPITKAVERKAKIQIKEEKEEEEDEDMMDIAQAAGSEGAIMKSVNMTGSRPAPKNLKPAYPSPENSSPPLPAVADVDATSWNNVTSKLNVLSS